MKKLVVVIEDESEILNAITLLLKKDGFEVKGYLSAEEFISERNRPDQCFYLVDWNLPGIQGIDIIKIIRTNDKSSPIFMMSSNERPEQIILGLQAGADDYIVKPFNSYELMVRIRNAQNKVEVLQANVMHYGIKILPEANCLLINGKAVTFTAREFLIFEHLYARKDIEINRADIIDLFAKEEEIQDRNIDVHVYSIRKKISTHKLKLDITTIWGKGYKLTTH